MVKSLLALMSVLALLSASGVTTEPVVKVETSTNGVLTLSVKGLEKNRQYELLSDGVVMGVWTAGELGWGIKSSWIQKAGNQKVPHYTVRLLPQIDYDAKPLNLTVCHIQRTMKAMADSTSANPSTVRILFYGQSIVGQHWSRQVMDELRRRYPTVKFEVENRAIGGYGAERLSRTAFSDMYPYYADLVFFHDYGSLAKYEEMVRLLREKTTAEIILWSSHLSRGQKAEKMLAERDTRTKTIADIAQRYGTMYVDLNKKWCEMLLKNGWEEYDILADSIHMNRNSPALDKYAEFLYEDMARLPSHSGEPAVNGTIEEVPLSDARVKKQADGTLVLSFAGNRVVALSDGMGASGATAEMILDGKPAKDYPEMWYTTRPGRGPMWMPFVDHVDYDSPLIEEKWTLTFLDGTKPDANPIVYSVEGSVTGPDGIGNTKERFRSKSGRAILDPKDINCVWQYKYAKKEAKVGFQVTWETKPLFAAPYEAAPMGTRTTLVQNCLNGQHELVIKAKGGSLGIGGFLVYRPRQ